MVLARAVDDAERSNEILAAVSAMVAGSGRAVPDPQRFPTNDEDR
jgi:hypothetical protein